jgi:hypothetical protein
MTGFANRSAKPSRELEAPGAWPFILRARRAVTAQRPQAVAGRIPAEELSGGALS